MRESANAVCWSQMEFEEPMHRRPNAVQSLSQQDIINIYVDEICMMYNIRPGLIKSIIRRESDYNPNAENSGCVGLMQISTYWHADRATKLGVTNFYDPYSNILLGADYISELIRQYEEPELVLMLYNMNHKDALKMHSEGKISEYAESVLAMTEVYEKGE
jgi:soluble lytic murein transglycosylase-like protein